MKTAQAEAKRPSHLTKDVAVERAHRRSAFSWVYRLDYTV